MANLGWIAFALLGAFCAAGVSVINKKVLDKIDHGVALSIQALVMLVTISVITACRGCWPTAWNASKPMLALAAGGGLVAGLAWHFGYKALQMSSVAQATPIDRLSLPIAVIMALIFLGEKPSGLNWTGIGLMVIGAILVAIGKPG